MVGRSDHNVNVLKYTKHVSCCVGRLERRELGASFGPLPRAPVILDPAVITYCTACACACLHRLYLPLVRLSYLTRCVQPPTHVYARMIYVCPYFEVRYDG